MIAYLSRFAFCVALALTLCSESQAARGGGGHSGHGGHGGQHYSHGHGHGHFSAGFYFGGWPYYGPWGYYGGSPYYYPPYAYPSAYYPAYAPDAPVSAVEQQDASWYYCAARNGYYPYVTECPDGAWSRVSPVPPAGSDNLGAAAAPAR